MRLNDEGGLKYRLNISFSAARVFEGSTGR